MTPATAGLVLTSGLASGQLLLSPMLGSAVQTAAALPVPPGMVAVTLQFCVQQAVANYVTPGSQVAVFNTFVNGKAAAGGCSSDGLTSARSGQLHTRLVLPKVLVLAVGEGTATPPSATAVAAAAGSASGSSPSSPSTIYLTMAVSQLDAERLIELGEAGSPYLALVTSASGTKADSVLLP
jgi:pilus assembly protein CpaB